MTTDRVPSGIDAAFQKFERATDAQRQDAVTVLAPLCAMVGDVCTLNATGEALDSDKSRAWLLEHKPHLMPPVYERSLAVRAFQDGNLGARGEIVRLVGMAEADRIAQDYGLRNAADPRRGKAPAADLDDATKKTGSADHRNNPFHKSAWNISKQAALFRAVGAEKCAAIASSVGSKIGATAPNPNF